MLEATEVLALFAGSTPQAPSCISNRDLRFILLKCSVGCTPPDLANAGLMESCSWYRRDCSCSSRCSHRFPYEARVIFFDAPGRYHLWFIRLPSGSPGGVRMTLALSGREGWGHARCRTLPPSAGARRAVDRAV